MENKVYLKFISQDFVLIPYLYYGFFLLAIWGIHLISISLVSSIHFSLGHDLQITEEWIYGRAWELVATSQIVAFAFVYRFFGGEGLHATFRELLSVVSWGHYKKRTFIIVLYFLAFVFFISHGVFIVKNSSTTIVSLFINSLGILITALSYFFWMWVVINTFIHSTLQRALFVIVAGGATFVVFKMITLYTSYSGIYFFILLLTSFFSLVGQQYQWNIGVAFIISVLLPLCAFLGFDPIYAHEQSWWRVSYMVSPFYFLIPMLITIFYMYKRRAM